jgi:quercetin dioxygenase-like cupin family protein
MRISMVVVLGLSLSFATALSAEEEAKHPAEKKGHKAHAEGEAKHGHKGHAAEAIAAADLKWHEAPGVGDVKGPQIAVVSGDPAKGAYAGFAKFAADTHHPLHTHPNAVKVVVISGTFLYGEEGQEPKELGAGSYLMVPGGHRHTSGCKAGAECVVFQTGTAKFATKPVGAAHDKAGKHEEPKHDEAKHEEPAHEEPKHEEKQ